MTANPDMLRDRFRRHSEFDGTEFSPREDERSFGELAHDLTRHSQQLVRGELDLFKVELTEKAKKAGVYMGMAVGAVLLAVIMLWFVGHMIAQALDPVMPEGIAYLIVALLYGAGAVGLGLAAKRGFEKTDLAPTDSIDSAKEDLEWVKTHR